jgi:DHA2 family multidrug resistance protein
VTEAAPAPTEGRIAYRWVAMGVVLFGTFMVVLDTTVVNLGLPALQRDFHSIDGVEWVVTAYLAAVGVAQMVSGWAADRFGRKSAFVAALVIFTTSSVLCALSPSLQLLVSARVLQGIGGGLLMPVAMAMIYELFDPSERGRALGYFGIAVMAAPAIGPVLGGGLVESVGWRWLFLINVPIGGVGIPVALRLLRDTGFRENRPLDRAGLALSGVGITLLLIGTARGGSEGWSSPTAVVPLLAGVALLVLFTRHALGSRHPLVEMRILANPVFAIAMVTMGLMAVAQYTRLVYIPLELGSGRGITELRIGLVMLPSALGIASTMPIGGRLTDRVGARIPVTIGLSLMALSYWPLAHLAPDTPLPWISAYLFIGGLGAGLSMMAPNIVAMNAVASRFVSQATGLSSVSRQLAAALGTAVLASVFATIRPAGPPGTNPASAEISAYNSLFLIGLGLLVLAVLVAQRLPGKAKALALQDARRQDAADEGLALAAGVEA